MIARNEFAHHYPSGLIPGIYGQHVSGSQPVQLAPVPASESLDNLLKTLHDLAASHVICLHHWIEISNLNSVHASIGQRFGYYRSSSGLHWTEIWQEHSLRMNTS